MLKGSQPVPVHQVTLDRAGPDMGGGKKQHAMGNTTGSLGAGMFTQCPEAYDSDWQDETIDAWLKE